MDRTASHPSDSAFHKRLTFLPLFCDCFSRGRDLSHYQILYPHAGPYGPGAPTLSNGCAMPTISMRPTLLVQWSLESGKYEFPPRGAGIRPLFIPVGRQLRASAPPNGPVAQSLEAPCGSALRRAHIA